MPSSLLAESIRCGDNISEIIALTPSKVDQTAYDDQTHDPLATAFEGGESRCNYIIYIKEFYFLSVSVIYDSKMVCIICDLKKIYD
jgi:hypothetical protein